MSLLNEALARERMHDRHREAEAWSRLAVARRVAVARRLQRRAESASRRARSLLMSV